MSGRTFCWLVLEEARRLLVARWVGAAAVLLCACSAFSVVLSIRDFHEHTASYHEMRQQRVEAQMRGTGRPWGREAEPGLRVIRPPTPGAVLAAGIEWALPAAWEFTPAGTETLAPYARTEVGINGSGVPDLAGIIAGLGGLLALWLGVSTVVSDRTAGRIAALRTLPVAPGAMALVRMAGGTLALAVVVAAWCLTVGLSVRVFLPPVAGLDALTPLGIGGPVLCYLTLLYALGTTVGASARDGLGALVTAFMLWMAIVFVIPQISQLITRAAIDVPSQTRIEVERREHMADAARLLENEIGDAMATLWPDVESPSDERQSLAYFAVGEPIWRAGWARIRDAAVLEQRQGIERRARADRVKRWLDGINPSSWLFESMAELAGTGRSTEAGWTDAITSHDQVLNEQLFSDRPRVNARVFWKGHGLVMAFNRHPPPRFSDLPPFAPPATHSSPWTKAALGYLAGLAAYTVLALAAAYVSLQSRLR